jgi:ACS family tartrate transporter-like MFS transporter
MLSPSEEVRVIRTVTLRLMPFLGICYIAAFVDRVNVGFAALQMQADLGFSDTVYALGAGMFFIGYFFFEVPSNVILEKVGARLWIARIMILWGIISSSMMFVQSAWAFYVLRFLLGAGEAGFFPGIILYLTYWFPAEYRSRTVALFMTAAAISQVVGAPISGLLLDYPQLGLRGWQWLFLMEGIPPVVLGIAVLAWLPNGPGEARWLSVAEREWLGACIDTECAERARASGHLSLWQALADRKVLILSLLYFLIVIGGYGLDLFMPKLLALAFPDVSKSMLGLLAAIPPLYTVPVMLFWGRSSDRRRECNWHVALPAFWAAAGLALASLPVSPLVALGALTLAVSGRWAGIGPFWGLPTAYLTGTAAAGGIAMINSIGNLGGFAGPYVMGVFRDLTGDYAIGLRVLAAAFVVGGLLALRVRVRRPVPPAAAVEPITPPRAVPEQP